MRFVSGFLAVCVALGAASLSAAPTVMKKPAAKKPVAVAPKAPAPLSAAQAEGIIFERQQIMEQLEKDAKLLGDIVAGAAPKEKLAATARAIAKGAKDSAVSFEANVPGGRSKPEVWSNSADFKQRMADFVKNADAMAKVAETGDVNGVISGMGAAMPCKACHTVYRAPKKPAAATVPPPQPVL